jgi:hypothetical protein
MLPKLFYQNVFTKMDYWNNQKVVFLIENKLNFS